MDANLKNYTSTVPAERTVTQIKMLLVKAGAMQFNESYANGVLSGVEFVISINNSTPVLFRMPVNIDAAYQVLLDQRKRKYSITKHQKRAIREQAERTAWRITLEWIEIQLSLVALKQAELTQVLLPYVVVNGQTLFDAFKDNGFKMLAAPAPVQEVIDA